LLGCAFALLAAPAATAVTDTSKLQEHVRVKALVKTMETLQTIADANGGTRASGTAGYEASVAHVVGVLEEKGYEVSTQSFEFPFFQELAPTQLERVAPTPQTTSAAPTSP
jgi:hypothetical protein